MSVVAPRRGRPLRLGEYAAWLAGLTFFFTVVYLFTILAGAGLNIDMFDDHRALLPWVAEHTDLYRVMWALYFISQAFLLPVPWLIRARLASGPGSPAAIASAVIGTAAITLSLVGLIAIFTASPILARAYVGAAATDQTQILLLAELFADFGKEVRLFSEVLLGAWLAHTGYRLTRSSRARAFGWPILAVGAYTVAVAAIKIVDPFSPLEDTLGFILGLTYCGLGWGLSRCDENASPATAGQPRAASQGTATA